MVALRFARLMPPFIGTVFMVALQFVASPARAQFLGTTVNLYHDFPTLGAHLDTRNNVVVGAGVEGPLMFTAYDADITDSSIILTFRIKQGFTPGAFNGFVLTDATNSVPPITSVTLDPSTNLDGFDASRITFNTNNINLNMQGLDFNFTTINRVQVNVGFSGVSAAPEPGSLALLGLSFAGMAGTVIRKRRNSGKA